VFCFMVSLNAFTAIEFTDKIQSRANTTCMIEFLDVFIFSPSHLLITRVGLQVSFLIGVLSPFSLFAFRKIGGFCGRHAVSVSCVSPILTSERVD
jgi:hypothetical protein